MGLRLRLWLVGIFCTAASLAFAQKPKVVGYFPQWALYDTPRYTMGDLAHDRRAGLLDQLNYAQAFVKDGHCSVADPNSDLNTTFSAADSVDGVADDPTHPFRGNMHQLQKLKLRYPRLKTVISLEGQWSSFAADAQPEAREAFVASCIDLFVKGHLAPGIDAPGLFDGIDIDWEYPHPEDAANYLALLAEFRRQLDIVRPGLLLTVAVGPHPRMMGGDPGAANWPAISKLVDEVGLMTYDFTGGWSHTTGFLARFSTPDGTPGGSVVHTVESYLQAGVPAGKLLVGIPFYGYGWKTVPEDNNGLYQEGVPIRGDRPYSYIEPLIANSTVYRDESSASPWLFDGDAFWTYEDAVSIQRKGRYVLDQHLGGLMIWELGEDTASATLLRAAHAALQPAAPQPVSRGNAGLAER